MIRNKPVSFFEKGMSTFIVRERGKGITKEYTNFISRIKQVQLNPLRPEIMVEMDIRSKEGIGIQQASLDIEGNVLVNPRLFDEKIAEVCPRYVCLNTNKNFHFNF